jgi:hypothetical protein
MVDRLEIGEFELECLDGCGCSCNLGLATFELAGEAVP